MTNSINGRNLDQILIEEDQIFTDLAIRDTIAHSSSISDNQLFLPRTVLIENSHNQSVILTCQGSRYADFSKFVTVGNTFAVAATTNDYVTVLDYFPYLRFEAICSVAPASGTLNMWVEKRS